MNNYKNYVTFSNVFFHIPYFHELNTTVPSFLILVLYIFILEFIAAEDPATADRAAKASGATNGTQTIFIW